jgi:integrase
MSERKTDPIKRIELQDGRTRYTFVIDVGKKSDGGRDQRRFTYDKLSEARAERARIISERAKGVYVRPNRKLTVREYFVDQWLPSKAGKKPATRRCYQDALAGFLDAYGALPLQLLDAPHLESLKGRMLSGEARRIGKPGTPMSPRAVNLMLTVVGLGLKAAMKRGLVVRNVAEVVDRVGADPNAGAGRGDWQTGDAKRFLHSVAQHRLRAAFVLSLLGLRRGEVTGLRWDDIDLTGDLAEARWLPKGTPSIAIVNNRVAVAGDVFEGTPKGKGRRDAPYLPIPTVLVDALKATKARQAAERLAAGEAYASCPQCGGAHVVVDEIGRPYRPEYYSESFVKATKAAGVPRLVLHGARHSAASLLADLGIPDVAAAAWLGHTQIVVTRGYQHAMVERLAAAGKALGDVLAG